MLGTEPQADQCEGVDFAVVIEFLIGLKTLERLDGIIFPLAVRLALEVAPLLQRFLNFLVAIRFRMLLPDELRWTGGAARDSHPTAIDQTA